MLPQDITPASRPSATVLNFPIDVVAAKVERARRIARTREWLLLDVSAANRDFLEAAPEWWWNRMAELREQVTGLAG